jgi:hypothetical protein
MALQEPARSIGTPAYELQACPHQLPNLDFHGSDSFTYTITDGRGGIAQAVVTVSVNPLPDAPVAVDDLAGTDQLAAVDVVVLENDYDVDGDSLSIISVTPDPDSWSGAVENHGTYVTYTPDAAGAYSFTYTISDGNGGTSTATVTITVSEIGAVTPMYVSAIGFEQNSKRPDTWRASFQILDGDGDGVEGVAITVDFAEQTFTGLTDADGVFTTGWVRKLESGTDYYANVLSLMADDYDWLPSLDGEDDSDDIPGPDALLNF